MQKTKLTQTNLNNLKSTNAFHSSLKNLRAAILLGCTLMIMAPALAKAGSAMLTWNASTNSTVAGYNVYYGGASASYTTKLSAGNNTSATINNLTTGTTYYFAVTSQDAAGHESPFSSEASYQVPATSTGPAVVLQNLSLTGGQFGFSVSGQDGSRYAIEASANLLDWVRVATNFTPFVFTETNSLKIGQKFFRAVYLP